MSLNESMRVISLIEYVWFIDQIFLPSHSIEWCLHTAATKKEKKKKEIFAYRLTNTKNIRHTHKKRNLKHRQMEWMDILSTNISWFSWQIIIKYCLRPTSIWILVTFMDYYGECFCHCGRCCCCWCCCLICLQLLSCVFDRAHWEFL